MDKMKELTELLIALAITERHKHQYTLAEVVYALSSAAGCMCLVEAEKTAVFKSDGVIN